ncbi:hypothetical protein E3N88_38634 [Mikania micrantha]|uniref:Uncharacterized protein n=1 Tax=Mikania micrantha TaxID=192012 RepID=A0A5N6LUL6_9ASTR|nr:hypothetical protein E3N88_38634 [Mikania micrantha]
MMLSLRFHHRNKHSYQQDGCITMPRVGFIIPLIKIGVTKLKMEIMCHGKRPPWHTFEATPNAVGSQIAPTLVFSISFQDTRFQEPPIHLPQKVESGPVSQKWNQGHGQEKRRVGEDGGKAETGSSFGNSENLESITPVLLSWNPKENHGILH